MKINVRVIESVPNAVNSLFFIKCHAEDEVLQRECQHMIDVLFERFPGVMPKPSRLLAEQDSRIVDELAVVMKR
jgi:hypothetical protein